MKHIYLSVVLILTFFDAESQTADFTYSTTSGSFCSPQVVKFTQSSSGSPVAFVWDFGNGKRGNRAVESVIYTHPGTYIVKLIAVYNNVAVPVSKTISINPGAQITVRADKKDLCVPGAVNFTASANPLITSYHWDFGDGTPLQTGVSNTIMHEFSSYDTFNITVQGFTASGCDANAATTVRIGRFKLTGTATPTKRCIPVDALLKIGPHFLPGDQLQNVLWNFGDGSSVNSNGSAIHHTYNTTTGIGDANVQVTTLHGCTSSFTFDSLAFGTPPSGTQAYTVTHRDTFCGSENVELFALANNAETYKWQFGDGSTELSILNITKHKFKTLGTKMVIVTPVFHGCEGQKDTIFLFIKGVIAKYDITNSCSNRDSYYFPNHSLGNISHFEWTFPDAPGSIDSINLSAGHIFPAVGSFYTNLILADNISGCRDTMKTAIYTATPDFSSSTFNVCKDSEIIFRVGNDYPPAAGRRYEFHVNGTVIDKGHVDSLSYHPSTHGIYNDYVVIKDKYPGTCNDSLYLAKPIRVMGPVIDFAVRGSICFDSSVVISNYSYPYFTDEPISTWLWNMGDAQTDTARDPAPHQYDVARTYTIKLTAIDINHCAQTLVKPVVINPLPRVDILPRADTICLNTSSTLIAYSSDPVLWTAGTAINCATCDTITVTPGHTTNYIATALSDFGCRNYDSTLVKVSLPSDVKISPADTSICELGSVQLNITGAATVTWSPSIYLSDPQSTHPVSTPRSPVTYSVIVKDPAGCFTDTLYSRIDFHPKPFVNAGNDRVLDYNEAFTLNPMVGSTISHYLWTSAATLSCNDCANPGSIALKKQTYTLRVTDEYGCQAEDDISIFINCANSNLFLPDAFTPNGDGNNDYFYPIARGYEMVTSFTIFNRNGVKVFERQHFAPNTPSLGWNGTIKGNQNPDTQTFIWIAVVECDAGQPITKRGTVVLIR